MKGEELVMMTADDLLWGCMAIRKIAADKIFDGFRMLQNHALIVKEDGTIEAVVPVNETGEGLERYVGLLTPGFINCHCHLDLSHMK